MGPDSVQASAASRNLFLNRDKIHFVLHDARTESGERIWAGRKT